jgi:hypothetical protein
LLSTLQAVELTTTDPTVQVAGLWDSIKDKASSSFADVKDWSTTKMNEVLGEFSSYLPVFHEAGFEVSELSVIMGLIPTLTIEFKQTKVIKPEEQAKILKLQESKKILSYLLQSLFTVYSLQLGKYKIASTEISLTVPPHTTVKLSSEGVK